MDNENVRKININWFPGHMTKAKREMQEKLKMVDMVIECRDARIPLSSQNPLLNEIIQTKPRVIILTKIDKADPLQTEAWVTHLSDENTYVLAMNVLQDNVIQQVTMASKKVMAHFIEKQKRRGINPRAIRVMVVGIPNVGKSTLINRIAKRKAAMAADRPGVTRALQWVKINNDLELLDTPGVLWPKFEDVHVGLCLGISGAIRDEVLPLEDVALFGLKHVISYYPKVLAERFDCQNVDDPVQVLEMICKKRNYTMNGEYDMERAIEVFIKEARDNKLGRITWEFVDGNDQ